MEWGDRGTGGGGGRGGRKGGIGSEVSLMRHGERDCCTDWRSLLHVLGGLSEVQLFVSA